MRHFSKGLDLGMTQVAFALVPYDQAEHTGAKRAALKPDILTMLVHSACGSDLQRRSAGVADHVVIGIEYEVVLKSYLDPLLAIC